MNDSDKEAGQGSGFEAQVTDLHTGADNRHPLDERAATKGGPDDKGGLLPTKPPYVRRVRAMMVTGVVLLAVALVVVIDPTLRASLSIALYPTPAPTATLAPDANLVLLESGAPWGAFSLDGLEPSPLAQTGSRGPQPSSLWIRLAPGHHTLQVTQPPFPSLKCSISLPAARSDTCPVVSPRDLLGVYFRNQPSAPPNSRTVDLGARFDRLPASAAAALVDAVRAGLSLPAVPVALLPGDHYLRDDGSVAVATMPLEITLRPELTPPDRSAPSDSANCQSFCDALTSYDRSGETGGLWSLAVAQRGSWRVTTADGQVIASHAPLWSSAPPYATLAPAVGNLRMEYDVRWNGSWQILSQGGFDFGDLSPALRQVAIQMTSALLAASPGVDTSSMNIYEGRGLDAGQGWVVSLTPNYPSATTPLILYYHFGMLLAANDAAHRAFPMIPAASANERAHARAIMGLPSS